jgi:hypothetical protein
MELAVEAAAMTSKETDMTDVIMTDPRLEQKLFDLVLAAEAKLAAGEWTHAVLLCAPATWLLVQARLFPGDTECRLSVRSIDHVGTYALHYTAAGEDEEKVYADGKLNWW